MPAMTCEMTHVEKLIKMTSLTRKDDKVNRHNVCQKLMGKIFKLIVEIEQLDSEYKLRNITT